MTETTDPLHMPLDDLRLVEASAGTGKTFTLAGLYLRLLIEQRLEVRDILVMTFTRAATQELRERIRARLARAAEIAAHPDRADAGPEDRITLGFIDDAGEDRRALARRLTDAAARMDEATITTIHGFSQMAVSENAFESGVAFDRGEQADDRPLLEEAVSDYWRRQVIGGEASELAGLWPTPADCLADLEPVMKKPGIRIAGPNPEQAHARVTEARQAWAEQRPALQASLERIAEAGGFHGGRQLAKSFPSAEAVREVLDEIEECVNRGPVSHPVLVGLSTANLSNQLKGAAKKAGIPEQQTEAVDRVLEAIPALRVARIQEAAADVTAGMARIKRERRLFSFDDMIRALHEAIDDPARGPVLAAALHKRWPWALVDEFQDTDPTQYAILRAIYADQARGGLIMIGDPKQAIYAFRGGDVFAYLQAADDARGTYSLDRNFRSSPEILTAIETVFTSPPERPFVIKDIDFHAVAAGRAKDDWWIRVDGKPLDPMTLWTLGGGDTDKPVSSQEATPLLQRQCIAEIGRLLEHASVCKSDTERPLAARDICVLVNSNAQAMTMQAALSRHGIPAACLHQSTVFDSDQARDMLRLLRAAATPADSRRVKAALTGELFGWRLGQLIDLARDETLWQRCYDRFQAAHQRWSANGVLAMLEPLIQSASAELLARVDGERRMTNWLHLAELLQTAEAESFGMNGLIRWLARQIEESGTGNSEAAEAAQLRLESDENLVRITTIYKAKGLQYPVVMLPFAPLLGTTGAIFDKPGEPPFEFHDRDHRACLELGSPEAADNAGQSIRERKAEALRLLYVGLTRAEQALYVASGYLNGAQNGALSWLLLQSAGCPDDAWVTKKAEVEPFFTPATLEQAHRSLLERGRGRIHEVPVEWTGVTPGRLTPDPPPDGEARNDFPRPRQPWRRLSFSALVRDDHHGTGTRRGADDETDVAEPTAPATAGGERCDPALDRLGGPGFGTAVHDVLETADFATWSRPDAPIDEQQADAIARQLRRHGIGFDSDRQREQAIVAIGRLVSHTLHTPLPAIGALSGLDPSARLAEMPFTLRLGGQSAREVIRCLQAHGYDSALSASHRGQVLRGLMQGFIDLIVEHEGRYWVLDYKTNRLGDHYPDYAPARLGRAVTAGHYDLQYLIYLTALHRHLKLALPDYDPATHLGGVQYLFLRGMNGRDAATGVFEDQPSTGLIETLDRLFNGEEVTP